MRAMNTAVLSAILVIGLVAPAFAASTGAPDAYAVEGYYAVSGKYIGYDFPSPVPWKGSYRDVFHITRISSTEVRLDWMDESASVIYWTYRAHYMDGVMLIGAGADTSSPGSSDEVIVVEFSGSPGKLKLTGKDIYYHTNAAYVEIDTLKGKMIPQP